MSSTLLQAVLVLVLVSAVGAVLPLLRHWSERGLHFFVCISAGIFLGAIFLHLLPELAVGTVGLRSGATAHEHDFATVAPWAAALFGLVLLFFIEKIWLTGHAHAPHAGHAHGGPAAAGAAGAARAPENPHRVVWFATFIGLSVHSFATGLGYAAVASDPALVWTFLGSIAVHKASETFSLATIMRLAGLGTSRVLGSLAIFCLAEPAGLLAGAAFRGAGAPAGVQPLLTGLACGTFLYVAVGNLLPEVFHGSGERLLRIGGLMLGIATAAAGLAGLG
ncbi:MAG TPA: ZIP family metal transporter [Planctomycetota bacterium]|nr:ZIP family metal transporter [Planctomycetota bacterium]